MAIHASVKYRSLKAGVTHQKLQLTASIRKAAVAVSQKNVVASILSRQISPSFSFAKLTAISSWQNLYLYDVHVNAERTIYVFNDSYAFLDAAVFVVDKSLSDSFGFLSEAPVFTVGKQLADTFSFSDVASSHPNKGLSDLTALADSQAFGVNAERQSVFGFGDAASSHPNKGLFDLATFSDSQNFDVNRAEQSSIAVSEDLSFHSDKGASDLFEFSDEQVFGVSAERQSIFEFSDTTSAHPNKGLFDLSTLIESQSFDVNRTAESSIAVSEAIFSHPNKGVDDLFEFSDEQVFGVTARRQSAFAPLDQLTVTRQPYNFVFSQSGDVVTVTGEPDDAFGFADGISSFSVSKSLQDFFALDDFAQINKDVEGVKSNVFGLIEYLESSFGKVIDTDLLGLIDQASLAPLKRLADSTPITDVLGLHASRLSTDETALDDAATLSFGLVKTDSAIILESLESNVGKSIQNQLFSLTDQPLFALSKSVAEPIILGELLTSHASKSVSNTTTLQDAATLSPRIGKSDSTSIVDSLDVEHVITGALLNQALIGNIILNAD